MASYPVDRVLFLLGKRTTRKATPTTLSKSTVVDGGICSYALRIVEPTTTGYKVHPRNSTMTTNRHVDAACRALDQVGYTYTHTDDRGWRHYQQGA